MPTLTPTQVALLGAPFAADLHRVRDHLSGGALVYYVDARHYLARLDAVFGCCCWSWTARMIDGRTCEGTLSLPTGAAITDIGTGGADGDEPAKVAATDALKRCCAIVGIGRYLYLLPRARSKQAAPSAVDLSAAAVAAGWTPGTTAAPSPAPSPQVLPDPAAPAPNGTGPSPLHQPEDAGPCAHCNAPAGRRHTRACPASGLGG